MYFCKLTLVHSSLCAHIKALVQALSELTFTDPEYTGAPTFAYRVGDYTVDKNGAIFCPDTVASEAVALLVEKLTERGFSPHVPENNAPAEIPAETTDAAPEAEAASISEAVPEKADVGAETPETPEKSAGEDEAKLTVSIPRDKLPDDALARLRMIVSNKEELFKRAVLTDTLPIEVSEDKVSFPWFTLTGLEGEAEAYTQFISCLCKMAVEQTRVLDKPYDGDNDRFAIRIFMVRLGMKGAQFALARKLMMKNLTGNSGWRYGTPQKKTDALSDMEATPDVVAIEEGEA